MSPWDLLSCGDIPIPLGKKILYFERSQPWHFKASILTYFLSIIIQAHPLTKETVHGMLWFSSEPTRNRKWLASHCHCPAATSRSDADRSAMHHFGQGMSECPLRAGTGPSVPTEIWRLQLGLAVIWWSQLGRSSAHRNLALTVEVRSAE